MSMAFFLMIKTTEKDTVFGFDFVSRSLLLEESFEHAENRAW